MIRSNQTYLNTEFHNHKPGMTLLELVVTLSIVVIMTGFVIFSGRHVGAQSLVDTNANLIKSLVNSAQDTAKSPPANILNKENVVVSFYNSSGNRYQIFPSNDLSCTKSADVVSIKEGNIPNSLGLSTTTLLINGDSSNNISGSYSRCVIFSFTDPSIAKFSSSEVKNTNFTNNVLFTIYSIGNTDPLHTSQKQINVSSNGLVTIN